MMFQSLCELLLLGSRHMDQHNDPKGRVVAIKSRLYSWSYMFAFGVYV